MRAGQLDAFAVRIERDRHRAREAALLALLAASAVAPAALLSGRLALALVVGAAAELVLASIWRSRWLMLVRELALRQAAYRIPEVRAFGSRVASQARRAWLAVRLDDLRMAVPRGPLAARLVAHVAELDLLAEALRSPELELEPSCAVACLQLLTDARRSPLLNTSLPADDLSVALHRIRAGFSGAVVGQSVACEAPDLSGKRLEQP
jgi:hypothetical protein